MGCTQLVTAGGSSLHALLAAPACMHGFNDSHALMCERVFSLSNSVLLLGVGVVMLAWFLHKLGYSRPDC